MPYLVGMNEHPKKPHSMKDLKEEHDFYLSVINEFRDDTNFVPLSNNDGTESKDYEGYFYIWYFDKCTVKNEITLKKIFTYTTLDNVSKDTYFPVNPSTYIRQVLEYLTRYYNMVAGKVIEIIYYEYNHKVWKYKPYETVDPNDPSESKGELKTFYIAEDYNAKTYYW